MEDNKSNQKISPLRRAGRIALKFFAVLMSILLVAVIAALAVIWVLAKGPSPTAQRLFVMSVRETSAVGWFANIYLSKSDIEGILGFSEQDNETYETYETYETDTSLIAIPAARPSRPEIQSSEAALVEVEEEAGDNGGIELFDVSRNGYRGYMLVVDDPSRVFVATPDNLGNYGMSLMDMVEKSGAVAGINAGGFYDPNGVSTGGIPNGIVICDGKLIWGAGGGYGNVIGFDADGILHSGTMTPSAAIDLGLKWAVSFGPTLISNGAALDKEMLRSGINPRTAIGQRADGAVLLLVIDGRQIGSLGATYEDLVEIFLDFEAVNAANLDGGASTLMIIDGEFINNCASVSGPRLLPTAFLVR